MKNKVFVIFFIAIITGCKKDNYSNNHTIDKNTLTYNETLEIKKVTEKGIDYIDR